MATTIMVDTMVTTMVAMVMEITIMAALMVMEMGTPMATLTGKAGWKKMVSFINFLYFAIKSCSPAILCTYKYV